MMFESQTHTQNAQIGRYSTRYGQAPAVALSWDWPRVDVQSQKGSSLQVNEWIKKINE